MEEVEGYKFVLLLLFLGGGQVVKSVCRFKFKVFKHGSCI